MLGAEAKQKADAEAKLKAEQQAKEKAEQEAEAKQKAEAEAEAKQKADAERQAEAERKAAADKEAAEQATKAEAEAKEAALHKQKDEEAKAVKSKAEEAPPSPTKNPASGPSAASSSSLSAKQKRKDMMKRAEEKDTAAGYEDPFQPKQATAAAQPSTPADAGPPCLKTQAEPSGRYASSSAGHAPLHPGQPAVIALTGVWLSRHGCVVIAYFVLSQHNTN